MAEITQQLTGLTALPTAPNPAEPSTFENRAFTWTQFIVGTHQGELNTLVSGINNFATQANEVKNEVNQFRDDTEDFKNEAQTSKDTAVAASNNKGSWSDLSGAMSVPASVNHNGYVWLLNTDIADVTVSEPTDVNTDWTRQGVSVEDFEASKGSFSNSNTLGDVVVSENTNVALVAPVSFNSVTVNNGGRLKLI